VTPAAVLVHKTLRDLRNTTLWLGLACAATAILMILLYPEIAKQWAEIELPEFYEVFLGQASFATPEGFIAGEFFGWIPATVVVLAIIAGTGAIAGEEANGTLELLLAQPLSRRTVLAAKVAGMGAAFFVICALTLPGLLIGRLLVSEFDLSIGRMLSGVATMLLLVWFFLAVSLLASAAFPSRAMAGTTVAAAAVIAYIVTIVAALAPGLRWLRWVSPFSWADFPEVMLHGMQWPGTVLLAFGTVLAVALAVVAFDRRDIGAATLPRLPWRRLRGG